MPVSAKPTMSRRVAPRQARSQKTVDQILKATAELLEELGFEKLSTNLICQRAGLTPPALYRYFPNKYAILKELGERLMDKQNAVLDDWTGEELNRGRLEAQTEALLKATIDVTRAQPAGGWIMRSLHASPFLSEVRLDSHRRTASVIAGRLLELDPTLDPQQVFERMRLGIEIGYAIVEMVFDEDQLDEDVAVRRAAGLLAFNMRETLKGA